MIETARIVEGHLLTEDGYEPRGLYMVKQEGNIEIRFQAVAHGVYEYDGQREIEEDKE